MRRWFLFWYFWSAEKSRSHLTATLNYKTKGSKYQSVNATHYI